jgi:hypothetical protein
LVAARLSRLVKLFSDCSVRNGDVVEYRQESVAKSAYQNSMEQELDDGPSFGDVQARGGQERDREIRYWSDFNRVYYIPRTVQKLPDTAEWENTEGDWNNGRDSFAQFNEVLFVFPAFCVGLMGCGGFGFDRRLVEVIRRGM